MSLSPRRKGTVPFGPYRTWYRVTGSLDASAPVLVVVHGGPGSTHDCLLGLADFAERGWPVVHYDQPGNGGSTHLPHEGADFWTVQLFLDELANLPAALEIREYVLLGQSWGGLLAAVEESSHLPHLEEPQRFTEVVAAFLTGLPPRSTAPRPAMVEHTR